MNIPKKPDDKTLDFIKENYFYNDGKINSVKTVNVGFIHKTDSRQVYKIGIGKRKIMRSHIVWFLEKGEWPKLELDHEDRNSLNDKIENLREVTHDLQQQNRNDYGGYRGFSISKELNSEWSTGNKRQHYRVRNQSRGIYLNRYYTREEAMNAIDKYWKERGMVGKEWNFEKN